MSSETRKHTPISLRVQWYKTFAEVLFPLGPTPTQQVKGPLTFCWRSNKLKQNIHWRRFLRFLQMTCWFDPKIICTNNGSYIVHKGRSVTRWSRCLNIFYGYTYATTCIESRCWVSCTGYLQFEILGFDILIKSTKYRWRCNRHNMYIRWPLWLPVYLTHFGFIKFFDTVHNATERYLTTYKIPCHMVIRWAIRYSPWSYFHQYADYNDDTHGCLCIWLPYLDISVYTTSISGRTTRFPESGCPLGSKNLKDVQAMWVHQHLNLKWLCKANIDATMSVWMIFKWKIRLAINCVC